MKATKSNRADTMKTLQSQMGSSQGSQPQTPIKKEFTGKRKLADLDDLDDSGEHEDVKPKFETSFSQGSIICIDLFFSIEI